MRPWPVVPAARTGVVTLAEARSAGWTPDALDHAVRCGRLVRVRRGAYAAPLPDDLPAAERADREVARAAVAAALVVPGVVVGHLAAATVRGWPTWAPRPPRACVTVPGRSTTRVIGVHVHRQGTPLGDVVGLAGLPVTAPARTVVDVATEYGTEAALVVADAAARARALDPTALASVVAAGRGRVGIERARPLPALLDAAAESPLESRSRWQLRVHRLPPPRTQVEVFTTAGAFLGRVDFLWDDGVVGEVDGAVKYVSRDVLVREKWRQERLERAGLGVVRWGAADLADFGPTAARLRVRLSRARAEAGPPGWWTVASA